MIAEGGRRHLGCEYIMCSFHTGRARPPEGVRRMPAMMLPRLKMIADKDGIEAERLGKNREIEQLARPELLRRRLVAKSKQRSLLTALDWSREERARKL